MAADSLQTLLAVLRLKELIYSETVKINKSPDATADKTFVLDYQKMIHGAASLLFHSVFVSLYSVGTKISSLPVPALSFYGRITYQTVV